MESLIRRRQFTVYSKPAFSDVRPAKSLKGREVRRIRESHARRERINGVADCLAAALWAARISGRRVRAFLKGRGVDSWHIVRTEKRSGHGQFPDARGKTRTACFLTLF